MGFSSSSETKIAHYLQFLKALMNTSLEMMSNFFYASPVTFSLPAKPKRLAIPAFLTLLAIHLQAVEIDKISRVKSPVAPSMCF